MARPDSLYSGTRNEIALHRRSRGSPDLQHRSERTVRQGGPGAERRGSHAGLLRLHHQLAEQAPFLRVREPPPGAPPQYGKAGDPFAPEEESSPWQNGAGAVCLEGRLVHVRGLTIAGLGGSIWYNGGENQFTNFTMFVAMLRLVPGLFWQRVFHGRFLDVLITHSPPYGINDLPDPCHTGFKIFLWFMRTFKPRYLMHGHVHLYDRNAAREAQYAFHDHHQRLRPRRDRPGEQSMSDQPVPDHGAQRLRQAADAGNNHPHPLAAESPAGRDALPGRRALAPAP